MKLWILPLVIAACSDPDPHAIETCESGWVDWETGSAGDAPITSCESACANDPSPFTPSDVVMACPFVKPPNSPTPIYCPTAWYREGGCCVPRGEGDGGLVQLYPCRDYR